jgi:hypothetical protein
VAVVVVAVVSVGTVLEDLVLLLQPLRANPARIKVNNIGFFIGGLNYASTDPSSADRFTTHILELDFVADGGAIEPVGVRPHVIFSSCFPATMNQFSASKQTGDSPQM